MATFTSKLGLKKWGSTEYVDLPGINTNSDEVDNNAGTLWVTDGTIPPNSDLYHGRVVREITSGKEFTARDNGSGGFNLVAASTVPGDVQWAAYSYGGTLASGAVTTLTLQSLVAGTIPAGEIVIGGNTLTFKRGGVYEISLNASLSSGSGNFRKFIESATSDGFWAGRANACVDESNMLLTHPIKVIQGTDFTLSFNGYQNTGGSLTISCGLRVIRLGTLP